MVLSHELEKNLGSRGETFYYLSERGQLKLCQRLIRLGMVLPQAQHRVLLAIYDRTFAWRKSEAVISDAHFLEGVRAGHNQRWDAAPIGLTRQELHDALDALADMGAIERSGPPRPITYSINVYWAPPGFRHMWEVNETDYLYQNVDD